jgi:hypothetical protein
VIYYYHKIRSNSEISHVTPYLPTVETNDNETENNRNNNIPKGSRLPFLSRRRRMKNDCQNFSKEVLERNADSFNNQSSANN